MSLSASSPLSLYQLAQVDTSNNPAITLSAQTLQTLVGAMIDVLIEQKISATLWVKLPEESQWFDHIERYFQQVDTPHPIYLCNSTQDKKSSLPASRIVPVPLQQNSQLQRESFLMFLSPQFWGMTVTQPTDNHKGNSVICTFEKEIIKQVLSGLEQAIAITDTLPDNFSTQFIFPQSESSSSSPVFINQVLLKQLQRLDHLDSSTDFSNSKLTRWDNTLHFNDEFFDRLVRELSIPLTNMKTALRLLDSPQIKAAQRQRYRNLLQRECDRQNSLIAGLQNLIQLDHSPDSLSRQSVQLEDLVPGIVSTYQPLAQEKGIQLGYTIPVGLPSVSCPLPWLQQVIINLLNNSLKFTPSRGQVSVRASVQGEYVEISVRDTGKGISPQDLPKIFDSFYRGRDAIQEHPSGAGLGLTIVHQLLLRCGGSISVTSQVNKCTTFKILLLPYTSPET